MAGCLGPSPDHFGFLEWMGVSGDEVRRAVYFEVAYQTVLRCSIRDLKNQNPKVVMVPDRGAADFLLGLFPGSYMERLDVDVDGIVTKKRRGRKPIHAPGTCRVQRLRSRDREREERVVDMMLNRENQFTMSPEGVACHGKQ